jgi:sulfite reductase (NADPH) flavoprotein alpha-component
VRNVAVQSAPVLGPQQIMLAASRQAARAHHQHHVVRHARRQCAHRSCAAPGQRKGETIYLNPYTGALLPELAGEDFFEWVEQLHRFLLLPRDPGKMVSGTLAFCLMGLALSGLYLRWPRRVWDWRTWLTFDLRMKGRSFLWGLHSVAGTWVMVVFLMFTASGVYWAFDPIRDMADGWMGTCVRRAKPPPSRKRPSHRQRRWPICRRAGRPSSTMRRTGRWRSCACRNAPRSRCRSCGWPRMRRCARAAACRSTCRPARC